MSTVTTNKTDIFVLVLRDLLTLGGLPSDRALGYAKDAKPLIKALYGCDIDGDIFVQDLMELCRQEEETKALLMPPCEHGLLSTDYDMLDEIVSNYSYIVTYPDTWLSMYRAKLFCELILKNRPSE